MRVYTRGVDEGLLIGRSVEVNVLEVMTDRVRLSIVDPNATPAYREEVLYLPSDDDSPECEENYSSEEESYTTEYVPMEGSSDFELAVSTF